MQILVELAILEDKFLLTSIVDVLLFYGGVAPIGRAED